MDNDLRQFLEAMAATYKRDLNAVETRLEESFYKRIDTRLEAMETRLEERLDTRLETMETKLLTAFHGWGRPMEVRVNGMTSVVMGFDERLALVEQRVSELERKRLSGG